MAAVVLGTLYLAAACKSPDREPAVRPAVRPGAVAAPSGTSSPTASVDVAPKTRAEDDRSLAEITKELEGAGTSGTLAGELYEKRGEILERNGKLEAAAAAYDEAARAYGQSPEANTMPIVRAERARDRARSARARITVRTTP